MLPVFQEGGYHIYDYQFFFMNLKQNVDARTATFPADVQDAPYADVTDDAWYTDAVRWAASEKIAQGCGNGEFGTNDPVTREQMVSLLWRMNGSPDAENADLSAYPDVGRVSPWAADAVSWAVDSGMIRGRDNGLAPLDTVTRAEAAQVLMNANRK